MKIVVAETKDFTPEVLSGLQGLGDVLFEDVSPAELAGHVRDAEVLWIRLGHRITRELLEQCRDLRFIVCPATGIDHIDLEAAEQAGIRVLSLKGETEFLKRIRATAEHTLSLSLALLRHLPKAFAMGTQEPWDRDALRGREIFENRVGIVGMGRLGEIVAGYFQALGAEVRVTDCNPKPVPPGLIWCDSIEELLPQCDLVSLHVDLNPGSAGLINGERLALMKEGSFLVNTSRGQIVDIEALLASLASGHLGAAALDVLPGEQAGEADPLFAKARRFSQVHPDKLVLTPHIGGATFESTARTEEFLLKRLQKELGLA